MPKHMVLCFEWLCVEVDLDVNDKDKVDLLDLIIDWEDEFIKTNKIIPKNPPFAYVWKMNHVKLNCDQDLMTMFERFNDNEMIFIWVGALEEESSLMKSIRSLRDLQTLENPVPRKTVLTKEKLPIRRRDLQEYEIMFPLNDYNEIQHDIVVMNATQDKWHDMEVESSLKTFENTPINDSPL